MGVSALKLVFPFLGKGVTKKEFIVKGWGIIRKSPCSSSHLGEVVAGRMSLCSRSHIGDSVLQVGSHQAAIHTRGGAFCTHEGTMQVVTPSRGCVTRMKKPST